MADVFLDTSYAIALVNERDQYHARALTLADEWMREGYQAVTTVGVLLEIGNALADGYREAAVALLDAIENDPKIRVVPLTNDLYHQALDLFRDPPDKAWGLVDCISFIVMREGGITATLTADRHFEQAGFTALLRS